MENYNSLQDMLIQDGILSNNNEREEPVAQKEIVLKEQENFFEHTENFAQTLKNSLPQKRINQYDLDLIKDDTEKDSIRRAINFFTAASIRLLPKNNEKIQNLFIKLFPRLYKARQIKDVINKIEELNTDVKTLLDKTIPYGEDEKRYRDLVEYLRFANQVQMKLKKKA